MNIDQWAEDAVYRHIGGCIRAEREALGFSQADLAQEIGMSRTSLVNIEVGRQHLPIYTLYRIATALGVSVVCLMPKVEHGE